MRFFFQNTVEIEKKEYLLIKKTIIPAKKEKI